MAQLLAFLAAAIPLLTKYVPLAIEGVEIAVQEVPKIIALVEKAVAMFSGNKNPTQEELDQIYADLDASKAVLDNDQKDRETEAAALAPQGDAPGETPPASDPPADSPPSDDADHSGP